MAKEQNDYERIEAIQDRYAGELAGLDIVSGHAVGLVGATGDNVGQLGLEIFVFETSGAENSRLLSVAARLRSEDVPVAVTRRDFRAVPIPPARRGDTLAQGRTDVFNPIIGGVSCGPDVNILWAPWDGTLGLAVLRGDGTTGLLSNKHVMYYDDNVTTVCQPARLDSFLNYKAGDHLATVIGNVPFENRPTYVDAAVASVIASRTATRRSIFGITNAVAGIKRRRDLRVGDRVVKSGLASGVTHGTLKWRSGSDPNAENQLVIEGDAGTKFAEPGDSGSVVLCGDDVIGLLWGENRDAGGDYAFVSPIEAVFEQLNLAL